MRKYGKILVAALLALSMTACGGVSSAAGNNTSGGNAEASGSKTEAVATSQTGSKTEAAAGNSKAQNAVGSSQTGASSSADSAKTETSTSAEGKNGEASEEEAGEAATVQKAADASDAYKEITGEFKLESETGKGVTQNGNVYTITAAGDYTASGLLKEGRIVIDAKDAEVKLILNGASITSSENSPIFVQEAEEVKLNLEKGTYNEITDARAQKEADEEDTEDKTIGNAAIYSKVDLKLTGKGSLVVNAQFNNGIQSTKDLEIKNNTLKVTAPNNALKGNDSFTMESGDVVLISTGGDGIKTEDSDVSSKGNQRGTVSLLGGNLEIYAACDGIDASYDVAIADGVNLQIYTDSYSPYTGEIMQTSGKTMDFYLILATSNYSKDKRYAAYFYNDDTENGVWAEATYSINVRSGRSMLYGLLLKAPSGYDNAAYFVFDGDVKEFSLDNYEAVSENAARNTTMNAYYISGITDGTVEGEYVSLSLSSGSEVSTKGIKADNAIVVDGGIILVQSKDDAFHANGDVTLENGETGVGDITVNGGSITVTSGDDGMHADNALTINGGSLKVSAYEGLEANVITLNDGKGYVYGSDDGMNATSGNSRPLIAINGGSWEVETPSGDTDAIDSNGDITMTGGFVLVKGGNSSGGMAGSVDLDGTISVTGGTIAAFGGICETPNGNGNVCMVGISGQSFAAGSYEVTDSKGNVVVSFELNKTFTGAWLASEDFTQGESYTLLLDGKEVYSWTQSSQAVGSTGFGGMGGFGGRGGGWRR
ncbi:MAG: carbohydrate-binding domain-containing protein [Lachnospiraceae bacterium]|nr:carbohydrate-binding domain-containing protein [Lachnospiraceae bacterium]